MSTMTRKDRWLAIVLVIVLVAMLGVLWGLSRDVDGLDTDDRLLNRQGLVNICIGVRQDAIDKWRAVATAEFTIQVDRSVRGLPIDTTLALQAEQAIYELVDEKQDIREEQDRLIDANDPEAAFVCPPLADHLRPPQIHP